MLIYFYILVVLGSDRKQNNSKAIATAEGVKVDDVEEDVFTKLFRPSSLFLKNRIIKGITVIKISFGEVYPTI